MAAPRNTFFQGVQLSQPSGIPTPLLPSVHAYENSGLARFGIGNSYRPAPYVPQNFSAPALAALRIRPPEPVAPAAEVVPQSEISGPGAGSEGPSPGGEPDSSSPGGISNVGSPTPSQLGQLAIGIVAQNPPLIAKSLFDMANNPAISQPDPVTHTDDPSIADDDPSISEASTVNQGMDALGLAQENAANVAPSTDPNQNDAVNGLMGQNAFSNDPPSIGMSGANPSAPGATSDANADAAAADAAANIGIDAAANAPPGLSAMAAPEAAPSTPSPVSGLDAMGASDAAVSATSSAANAAAAAADAAANIGIDADAAAAAAAAAAADDGSGDDGSDGADGGGGGGGGGKIICTAMNDLYGLPYRENKVWIGYAAKKLTPAHQRGYHKVFLPLVKHAYKSGNGMSNRALRRVLHWIAVERTRDLRDELAGRNPRPLLRALVRKPAEWLLAVIGRK